MASSKILHFHIPKTAGTALREYFCRQIGDERVSPGLVGMRLREAVSRYSRFDVISGHFSLYQGDVLPGDRLNLTVVRDPVDRFLSDFFYKKAALSTQPSVVLRRELSLDEYIEDARNSGNIDFLPQIAMLYPLASDPHASLTMDEKALAAIRSLDRFDLVGTQEEIEDFAHMICAQTGWLQQPVPRSNVTARRMTVEDLPPAQRTAIERLLKLEIEFYRCARERFRGDRRACICARAASTSIPAAANEPPGNAPAKSSDFGDRRCEVLTVEISGEISGPGPFLTGERLNLDIRFAAHEAIDHLNVGISIRDDSDLLVYGTNSRLLGNDYTVGPGEYKARYSFFNRLGIGRYRLGCSLLPTGSHHEGCYHWKDDAAVFDIYENAFASFEGRLLLDTDFELVPLSTNPGPTSIMAVPLHPELRTFGHINGPLQEFLSAIEPLAPMENLPAGIDVLVPLRLSNPGEETWKTTGRYPVRLSYRWYGAAGELLVADGLRTTLPMDMERSQSVTLPLQLRVPTAAGTYTLVVSLVQEAIAWFVERNAKSCYTCTVAVA
ncbi:MAG: Wzt carbohydrate-binding domain-containing protein [Rudaea sp.]|uniref:Wzt carbohydrate-binding domain-containing protein n=1 Tax=Rudaea sp. TaxID=2136325 RepID=UPI0039E3FAF0